MISKLTVTTDTSLCGQRHAEQLKMVLSSALARCALAVRSQKNSMFRSRRRAHFLGVQLARLSTMWCRTRQKKLAVGLEFFLRCPS